MTGVVVSDVETLEAQLAAALHADEDELTQFQPSSDRMNDD
jgi:hypothetical protein